MDETLKHLSELLDSGVLSHKNLEKAVSIQKNTGEPLDKVLVEKNLVTKDQLLEAKSKAQGVGSIDLDKIRIDPNAVVLVPQAMAKRYLIICVGKRAGGIMLAMEDPGDAFAKEYVKMRTGFAVQPLACYIGDLEKAWTEGYALQRLSTGFSTKTISSMRREAAEREKKSIELPGFPKLRRPEPLRAASPRVEAPAGTALAEPPAPALEAAAATAPPASVAAEEPAPAQAAAKVEAEMFIPAAPPQAVPEEAPAPPAPPELVLPPTSMRFKIDELAQPRVIHTVQSELDILSLLAHSATDLNTVMDSDTLITRILETAMTICRADAASLLLLEEGGNYLVFRKVLGARKEQIERARLRLSEDSVVGWCILHRESTIVNDTSADPRHCKTVDKKVDYETRSLLCVPILWGNEIIGALEMVNKINGNFTSSDMEYVVVLASQAAVAIRNNHLLDELSNFHLETVEIIIDLVTSQDTVSKYHAEEVARLAVAMAQELDLEADLSEQLCYAAFLHDIGKIRCHDKDDPAHAVEGAQLLGQVHFFHGLAPLVRHHHERFDGSGYPDGLKGQEIPLGARVLAVVEAYSEGKAAAGEEQRGAFLERFLADFGTRFDPALKAAFSKVAQHP